MDLLELTKRLIDPLYSVKLELIPNLERRISTVNICNINILTYHPFLFIFE